MQQYSNLPSRKFKFTNAQAKTFYTNYYSINIKQSKQSPASQLYQYSYSVQPQIQSDSTYKLQSIIRNIWKQLKQKIGLISIRGNNLYGTKDCKNMTTYLSKLQQNQQIIKYQVLVKKIKDLPLADMIYSDRQNQSKIAIQVLNIDTKQRLRKMNMIELDQGKYYSKNKHISQNFSNGLYMLRGYSFTTEKLKIGLCLQVDLFSRLIRQRNVLQQMDQMKTKDQIKANLINAIVITRYGNFRTYKIIDVLFDKSPMNKFIPTNKNQQTTYCQYYKRNYNTQVKIKNQPLLKIITKTEKVKRKGGQTQRIIHEGCLIPELVSLVGLSEQHRKNPSLMREISDKTNITVDKRINESESKIDQINEVQGLFDIGNTKIVNGYQLQQPIIQLKRQIKAQNGQLKIQKQPIKQPAQFKKWLFIFHHKNIKQAKQLQKALQIASKTYDITLQKSDFFQMQQTDPTFWLEDIQQYFQQLNHKKQSLPQIVMILIGGNTQDTIYHAIKNLFTTKLKICSQFTTVNKVARLNSKNHLLSYASSIILQMNSKIGKSLWQVPIKNVYLAKKNIAVCGIAVSKNNNQYSLGFVGTINNKLSKVYNQTITKKRKAQFTPIVMSQIFTNWIRTYYTYNLRKFLPEVIAFYREGLNMSQSSKNVKQEIQALRIAIDEAKKKTKMSNYNPQIVYMSVNKNSSVRFYQKLSANSTQKFAPKFCNPPSGCVIVDQITTPNIMNFNLISTCPNINNTTSPVQVTFHYHEPKKTPEQAFIQLTFEQCFNYYNWKGAIRPPACLQNADRLAKMAGKTLKQNISYANQLSKTYHFL